MRLAIISDIHGNLEALQAVVADLREVGADSVVCLGDNIGYGPNPEEVLELVEAARWPCVMGNHELGLTDPAMLSWFNLPARRVLEKTREMLSDKSLEYISHLPLFLVKDGLRFVHGFPPDSATGYLYEFSREQIAAHLSAMNENICFVGHTHQLKGYALADSAVSRLDLTCGLLNLEPQARYLINVGSVGQPRDGDPHAKYLIYDHKSHTIEVRFVPYDIPATAVKIRALGFPEYLAARLGEPLWD